MSPLPSFHASAPTDFPHRPKCRSLPFHLRCRIAHESREVTHACHSATRETRASRRFTRFKVHSIFPSFCKSSVSFEPVPAEPANAPQSSHQRNLAPPAIPGAICKRCFSFGLQVVQHCLRHADCCRTRHHVRHAGGQTVVNIHMPSRRSALRTVLWAVVLDVDFGAFSVLLNVSVGFGILSAR